MQKLVEKDYCSAEAEFMNVQLRFLDILFKSSQT
jgi:hypothetical protein